MQCRICLDDGDQTTLLSPCRCRGSSSYIHRGCLERYIQYYPDRICRVCNSQFIPFMTTCDYLSGIGILLIIACLLFVSNVRLLVKVVLMGITSLITGYFFHRNLFGTTPIVFVLIFLVLFLPGGHPSAVYLWLAIIGILGFLYMLTIWVPAIFIAGLLITGMLALYVGFITVVAYQYLDPAAFSAYMGVLYLLWYGFVHDRPFPRYRMT